MAYTDAERAEAVELYLQHGLAEAHRRTDVSRGTLRNWAKAAGHDTAELSARASEKTKAATEARIARMGHDKTVLAADLLADLQRLRSQLFAPCVEKKIVTLSGGKDHSSGWEVAEAQRDQPTFSEQVSILTSIGIAVDKVQILTGEATSIVRTPWDPERVKAYAAEEGEKVRPLHSVG